MAEREKNSKAETRARATRSTSTVGAAATPSDRVATETCPPPGPSARMTRRELLRGLGASAIVALAGCLPIGGEDVPVPSQPPTAAPDATAAALAEVTQPDCVITPRQTEGPFYFDVGQVRRDITEGKPGTPLLVALRLVEAGSCAPIRDAVVDVWHSDASGQYSGYRGQGDDGTDTSGETFLRGMQVTDVNGLVEFETIYPGWYPGRTVHIHFKIYTGERRFITSQMYFPDEVTDTVYLAEPYSARGPRSTTNENDSLIIDDPAHRDLMGHVTRNGDAYVASLTIGIVR